VAACKINLSNLIIQEANNQGVDPGIALAVARTESGVCQWAPDGSVVMSSAGAIGVMQLEPATAAQLGVDPHDVNQNIRGGVTYLKQLYQKYGNWSDALAAYNWGPGKMDNALLTASAIPGQVLNYVRGILGIGTVYNAGMNTIRSQAAPAPDMATVDAGPEISAGDILSSVDGTPAMNVNLVACLALGGFALALVWLRD
jgi:soluble lytic murein transglycosylase-like protein